MVAPLEKPMALEMRMDGPFILVSNAIGFPRVQPSYGWMVRV